MPVSQPDQPALGTVIHLGAASDDRVQEFRARGAGQILLVEPEQDRAATLKRRFAEEPGVRVLAAAAGAVDGTGELRVMSLAALNSLAAPTPALTALYPGLRQDGRQDVHLLSPDSVMAAIDAGLRPLMLVIDMPGQELGLLKAWKAAGQLEKVDILELRCGEEPFYTASAGRSDTEAWLALEGFSLLARDMSDPDWPLLHLQIDRNARALARESARAASLEKTVASLAADLDAARTSLQAESKAAAERDAAFKAASDRAAILDKSLAEAKAATEAKATQLTETEARLKAASDRAAILDKSLAEAKSATEAKAAQLTETEARLKAASDRAAILDKSLAEAKSATEAKAAQLTETEARLKAASDRAAILDKSLAEAKSATEAKAAQLTETEARLKAASDRAAILDKSLAEAKSATEAKATQLTETEARLKAASDRAAILDKSLAEAKGRHRGQGRHADRDRSKGRIGPRRNPRQIPCRGEIRHRGQGRHS